MTLLASDASSRDMAYLRVVAGSREHKHEEVRARSESWLTKAVAWLRRHPWSLSTSSLAALCFVQLAREIREGELVAFDAWVGGALARWRGRLDPIMLGLTRFGEGRSLTLVSVIVVALLASRGRYRQASYLVLAAGGSALLNGGLKVLFQRARPGAGALYLVTEPSSFSFPSGHAMCSAGVLAGLAVLAQTFGWKAAWSHLLAALCLLLAVGVGASRIYLGVHFASDVMGGQLAAAAWVSALTGWFYPRLLPGERAEQPAPS